jgi:hypothetical protein
VSYDGGRARTHTQWACTALAAWYAWAPRVHELHSALPRGRGAEGFAPKVPKKKLDASAATSPREKSDMARV